MDHLSEGWYGNCVTRLCVCARARLHVCIYTYFYIVTEREPADICNAHCLFKANGREQYTFTIHRYIIRCGCLNTKQPSKNLGPTKCYDSCNGRQRREHSIIILNASFVYRAISFMASSISCQSVTVKHCTLPSPPPTAVCIRSSSPLFLYVMHSDYGGVWPCIKNDRSQRSCSRDKTIARSSIIPVWGRSTVKLNL